MPLKLLAFLTPARVDKLDLGPASLLPVSPQSLPEAAVLGAQLWSCFSCQAGGDVFSFMMKQEGIPFLEAVKKLCKKDIQPKDLEDLDREREDAGDDQASVDRPPQAILDRVVQAWQQELATSTPAQQYLKGRKLMPPNLLRALKVGFSAGSLPSKLPHTGKTRRQLQRMRILNEKGNEFFSRRIVVPILDDEGVLVQVYGRSIGKSEAVHLYLPGPRRGVFNPAGIVEDRPLVLTESILDAVALLGLGIPEVTASFGVNGFCADLRARILRAKVPRVLCAYDADPAGDPGAIQLAHTLAGHGIEVHRVILPVGRQKRTGTLGGRGQAPCPGMTHDAHPFVSTDQR